MTGKGSEPGGWDRPGDPALETRQLDLRGEHEHLPWLAGADDEDWGGEAPGGLRMLGFAAMVLAVLILAGGALWWAAHRRPDPALLADGSVIEAPAAPYKQPPLDPGGKTFDGTGDTSFAVSAGQNRPPQLGGTEPVAAAPGFPAAGVVGVQVGAFSSQAEAEAGWARLVAQAGDALGGVSHRVVTGSADIGSVYRLQAVAGDPAAAAALCARLKAAGISCKVK